MRKSLIIIFIFSIISLFAFVPGSPPTPVRFVIPPGWPRPDSSFRNGFLTKEGISLGRKLFYDGRLSKNNRISCGSCHEPRAAFASFDHDFSHGYNHQFSTRNSLPLQNLAWAPYYDWDGKFRNLQDKIAAHINAPNEMGEHTDSVVQKLRADKSYRSMFRRAYGDKEITESKMLDALTQFIITLVSSGSKYDRVMRGEDTFNSAEENGYEVFKVHCSVCHREPLFTDFSFRNNGIGFDPYYHDIGRMAVTENPDDSLKFRVSSLRNAALTFPYMHDGRFSSLSAVIDHYSGNIHPGTTLDSSLQQPLHLTKKEKFDLVYFLHALTDSSFITNPGFLPSVR